MTNLYLFAIILVAVFCTVKSEVITIPAGKVYYTEICTDCTDYSFSYTLQSLDDSILTSCFYANGNKTFCYSQLSCTNVIYCSRPTIELDSKGYTLSVYSQNILLPAQIDLTLHIKSPAERLAAGIIVIIVIACIIGFICFPCIIYRRYKIRKVVIDTNRNYIHMTTVTVPLNSNPIPLLTAA